MRAWRSWHCSCISIAREMNLSKSPSLATLPGGSRIAPEQAASNLRILVVDDDPGMRTVIAAALHADGYNVQTANDGSSALSLHSQQPFDGVVADLMMPGMSGRELGSAVKHLTPGTPVICVTGYHQKVENSPFSLVIRKPFPQSVLCAAVKLFCTRHS